VKSRGLSADEARKCALIAAASVANRIDAGQAPAGELLDFMWKDVNLKPNGSLSPRLSSSTSVHHVLPDIGITRHYAVRCRVDGERALSRKPFRSSGRLPSVEFLTSRDRRRGCTPTTGPILQSELRIRNCLRCGIADHVAQSKDRLASEPCSRMKRYRKGIKSRKVKQLAV
jgi:hypothetical protein